MFVEIQERHTHRGCASQFEKITAVHSVGHLFPPKCNLFRGSCFLVTCKVEVLAIGQTAANWTIEINLLIYPSPSLRAFFAKQSSVSRWEWIASSLLRSRSPGALSLGASQ
jgi:hypothetical protein